MTDADVEAQKARVTTLIEKWKDLLWLGHWRFNHTFARELRQEDKGKDAGIAARVATQWEYLSATFDWFLPPIIDLPDEELDEYVGHEFLHVVVAEMAKGKYDPHEERVVTHLARVLHHITKPQEQEGNTDARQEVPVTPEPEAV